MHAADSALDRLIPARFRTVAPEALKFAIVGGLNTVINFMVLNVLILTVLPDGPLKANVIATVVAMVASYLMNRHWTFRDRPRSAVHREFMLFVLFNAAGLAIELAVMGATKYGLGLTAVWAINAAKFVGVVLGTLFRFFTYRRFVFAPASPVTVGEVPASTAPAGEAAAAHAAAATAPTDRFVELTEPLEAELAAGLRATAFELAALDTSLDVELSRAPRPER